MSSHETESRDAFQLERLILFSDAVFAIALTLLVIEIKIPALHGEEATDPGLLSALGHLVPKFLGFFLSFFLIGLYWTRHHGLFRFVARSTPRLLWINLLFLLSVVLMPFSTGIFGEYSTPGTLHLKTPLIIYVLNIAFIGVMNFWMWNYIGTSSNGVSTADIDPMIVRQSKTRAILVPCVFLLAIPVAFVSPIAARYVPILIPIVMRVFRKWTGGPGTAGTGSGRKGQL
jgi:uncharacterized membrane protein